MPDVMLFLPELVLLGAALFVFVASVAGANHKATHALALVGAIATAVTAGFSLGFNGEPFFPGIYRVDLFSQVIKLGIASGLALILMISRDLPSVRRDALIDLPFFLIAASVGMMLLVSATELLTIYVALEFSAYALYIAVAVHRRPAPAFEGAIKYVLLGAATSAFSLYGLTLIFGVTGTTYLTGIKTAMAAGSSPLLVAGLVIFFAGFLFKLAVFPFHFWAPDVYQGGPHQIVTFVATVSKVAAVAIIARLCTLVAEPQHGMFQLFAVLSVISMTLGNLAAIGQNDLKRLLAYSAVAQAGYLMLGFAVFSELGLASALFYGLIYLPIAFVGFAVVCALGEENPTLESIAGLYQRSPGAALLLLGAMFGLAGIPPTAGFIGKWFLFSAAIERGQFYLVLVAAINSTIALYYYLKVVKAAYLTPADGRPLVRLSLGYKVSGFLAMGALLYAGVYPAPLWRLCRWSATVLLRASGLE